MQRRSIAAAVVLLATLAACGDDDDAAERGLDGLDTPTFPAEDDDASSSTTAADDDTTTTAAGGADGDGSTTTAADGGGEGDEPDEAVEKVSFDDPVGDATPGVGTGNPPPWTDLAGGSLERQGDAYRLVVRLGGEAPEEAPGTETMNIASFYDVDGDGHPDYEIWVNLGPDGWGPVWYDDEDNAAIGEDSNVTVIVEGDEVRLLFPDVMLDQPDRLRFSIASEYGELAQIGSSFARRDDAPDDDEAVSFP